jgi:hypothetical protein
MSQQQKDRVRRAQEAILLMETLKAGIINAGCRTAVDVLEVIDGLIFEARLVRESGRPARPSVPGLLRNDKHL